MENQQKTVVGAIVAAAVLFCIVGALSVFSHSRPAPPPSPLKVALPETPTVVDDHAEHLVYHADFAKEPGAEWNLTMVNTTPKGDRPYLGDFYPVHKPTLTLKNLPVHKLVRITFDLFLMDSWDGSNADWGPGLFDVGLGLEDGRSLIHSTFSNCGFFSDNNEQSFPDDYPAMPYPAWTLGTEHQTLGRMKSWPGPGERTFDTTSVYHMVLAFPHGDSSIALQCQSTLPNNANKQYGLANVQVETLPELRTLTEEELATAWRDLGDSRPEIFFKARWTLISAGDPAAEYIATHAGKIEADPSRSGNAEPGAKTLPYPLDPGVRYQQRARNVLEAIHSPRALAIKETIPAYVPTRPAA